MRDLILLVVLVAACAGLAQTSQGHVVLSDAGLYKQPASYTELTFTTPSDLPSALPTPTSPINVSFSIHNASGAARAYQWSVVLTKASQSQVKATGTAQRPPRDASPSPGQWLWRAPGGGSRFWFAWPVQPSRVNFWVTCPASAKRSK